MKTLLAWVVAGTLGGAFCGVIEALALRDAVSSVMGAVIAVVGRLATLGATLGLIFALLDIVARRLVNNPRRARALLILVAAVTGAVLVAAGAHKRDGGTAGAFGFLAIAAASVTFTISIVVPRRRPIRWRLLAGLGCAIAAALLLFDPEGLRGTYKSLDLLLLGCGIAVASTGLRGVLHGRGLSLGLLIATLTVTGPRALQESHADLSSLVTTSARVDIVDRVLVAGGMWPARRLDAGSTGVDPAALLQPPRPRNDVRAAFAQLRKSGEPLNVLWVTIDALRSDATGLDGDTASSLTPNLDALARSGFAFPDAWSQAPQTTGSMESFLTGRYPSSLNRPKWGSFPAAEEKRTLAHVLRGAGYRTAVAGKWQLTLLGKDREHPHRLGFDEYCVFAWHEGPRYYEPFVWQNGKRRDDVADRYGPDVYTDFLIDFMAHPSEKPFFAFYSMALAHDVTDDLKGPVPFARGKDRYDSFAEMMAALDRMVGKIIDAIDKSGRRDDTLVVFVADNGSPSAIIARVEGGKLERDAVVSRMNGRDVPGGKGRLTDAGIRVPMIARWPGKLPPGSVSSGLLDATDFLPTFASIAGAELPKDVKLDGHSFAKLLHGGATSLRTWIRAERNGRACVRDRRWKLYANGRLFDLRADPEEKRPVKEGAGSAAARAARARLAAALR